MAKRRLSKASKRRLNFFGTISLLLLFYLFFSILCNGYTIYELTNKKQNLEKELIDLQEQAEELKNDIEKLNDEEYLANYAREHYLYSKDGEYIIHIEENDLDESIDNIEKDIDKNYIIIGLSALMLIIIIYIFRKGRNK